ncbi:MAG TPA: sterol desaturase family protein [Bacteroidia bacterium]|nr:sterol desaturase family protein [Bacteroidia bacterium]HNP97835.1 sterol desaturase family protein [Bacteroidia bacterium]
MENTLIINFLSFVGAFSLMEGVAWTTHKYVMHGFLWNLHESHHRPHKGAFEKNDFFFLIYASIAICLMYFGYEQLDYRFWMGLGVTAYGFTYFLLHDVFIHRRGKWLEKINSRYFQAMRKAHKVHHKCLDKEGAEEFGLLLFKRKHFRP